MTCLTILNESRINTNIAARKLMKMNLPDNITNKTTLKEIVSV